MDHFQYQNGQLCAETVSLENIAADVGTPFYVYSTATLTRHYRVYADAFEKMDALICFAVKANSNLAVIRTFAKMGAGADVVSGGELERALRAGVPAERIVFSGVGKTSAELTRALEVGVLQINVESEPELLRLSELATARGQEVDIAIRVNPDVDAKTHAKITTGRLENKFGIEWTRAHEIFNRARDLPGIRPVSVAVHIGSQLTDLSPFAAAFERVRDLVLMLRADGHDISRVDLGGGLGIPYGEPGEADDLPSPADYAAVVQKTLGALDCRFLLEPGRLLVGNAGVLVARVEYVKEGATRTFAILDAAMNDLARPTLYDAYHAIQPLKESPADADAVLMDVVGPICETGDTFARQRSLPPLQAGDFVALRTAGAYGAVQASNYNTRPLVAEVLVDGDTYAVVRPRQRIEDLLASERMAPWLD